MFQATVLMVLMMISKIFANSIRDLLAALPFLLAAVAGTTEERKRDGESALGCANCGLRRGRRSDHWVTATRQGAVFSVVCGSTANFNRS